MLNNATAFLPKYITLAEQLRHQIQDGQFASGEQITSEPSLCEVYNLSRGTVRQAIQLLVDQGLLVRKQGLGTFVASPFEHSHHFSLSSFDDEMRRQHRQPSTKLLSKEIVAAGDTVSRRLAIEPNASVFQIKRLRLADGQPAAVETRYLAQSLCPQLAGEDLENVSLHWLFVQKYQIPLVRMEHVVEIQTVTEEAAALLQLSPDVVAFHVDRLTFTTGDSGEKVPAVWFQGVYCQENYHIQTNTL